MSESTFQQLYKVIEQKFPNYSTQWMNSFKEFGPVWEKEISTNVSRVFGEKYNEKWDEAVVGYAEFCTEALRAQIFFEKNDRYKASNYEEVVKECYHSPEYMLVRYCPGQYLSHYIWPHHQKMLQHFVNELVPMIKDDIKLFYEVGVGCGMYSQKALEHLPGARGVGFDISDYALQFTKRIVDAHGLGNRYQIRNQNIITNPIDEKADLVISQEVLEHLEDPQSFIHGLYHAAKEGGWGYITAAINAAHTDHIYLYRSSQEVQSQIENAGWIICDIQNESNYPEKPVEFRPTIVGYLVRKK